METGMGMYEICTDYIDRIYQENYKNIKQSQNLTVSQSLKLYIRYISHQYSLL